MAFWAGSIASGKGRSYLLWFLLGFCFNILGVICAYVAPPKPGETHVVCPFCAGVTPREAVLCQYCGNGLRVELSEQDASEAS